MLCFCAGCQMTKLKTNNKISPNQMVESQEIHCPQCGRFIGYQAILYGIIQIKCPNCKEWITIDVLPNKET